MAMELRKLQETGGSTYVVSLPKKWISRKKLGKGGLVAIEEKKDGSLVISPGSAKEKFSRECVIATDKNLGRHLIEKYLLGYDVIKILAEKKFKEQQKAEVKKLLKKLVGLEIIEESSGLIVVQYLLDPEEVSILKSLRRMYAIVSVMHKDLINALNVGDKTLFQDIIQRDEEVNRLYFLLVRQIRTIIQNPALQDKEGISSVDCIDYRLVAKIIESIGDCLELIAKRLHGEKGTGKSSELKAIAEKTFEIHKSAFEALLKKDEELAIKARELGQFLESEKLKTSPDTAEIINSFIKIAEFGQDLADIVVCE